MMRMPALVTALLTAAVLTGCIQRTISIESTPPGALVFLNDQEVGRTPVVVPFTFYGKYDVRVEKDGFQSLSTLQKAQAPWWEAPGPDIFAEALPGRHSVNLKWHYTLEPTVATNTDVLVNHAKQLRALTKKELGVPPIPADAAVGAQATPIPAAPPAPANAPAKPATQP